MIEICANLFVGNQVDYESIVASQENWAIVHACKEPYHRQALGYSGRGAPKTHPEYLFARRGDRLILNLVDADDPTYIPKEIIDAALLFIFEGLQSGKQVLVHCNQGTSRSPVIGLLYLAMHTDRITAEDFPSAEREFRDIYPLYSPAGGMRGFALANWGLYAGSTKRDI